MITLIKKIWWVILLVVLYFFSRSSKYDFRYDPHQVLKKLQIIKGHKEFKQVADGLQYLQVGDDTTKPYVVFVHGSPGSLWDYGGYLTDTTLAKQTNMISIDRLGFGYSQYGKAERNLAVHADKLKEILLTLPHQKTVLVGHSFGGPVLAKAVMTYPHLINGLLMIAPSISPGHEPANWWRRIIDFSLFRLFTPPALRVCNQEIIPLKKELKIMEREWANVMTPITVIQGTEDRLVPMGNATFAKNAMDKNPHVKVVMLENENHFILWTKQDVVKKELSKILTSEYLPP